MKTRKIYGITLAIIGMVLILISVYIKQQVDEGQKKLSTAEELSDFGNKILSITPGTKEFSETPSNSIKEKVKEGKEQVAFYTTIASCLKIGGLIFFIAGSVAFLLGRKKERHK